ncbi:NlpC/P60 family protein [Oenococcus alcoholitolerans]|uniref:C40 family peptidase n=1 Tax=Oenococcus alcoholitolerans TaxID=931074 RepID=UPI003F7081E8
MTTGSSLKTKIALTAVSALSVTSAFSIAGQAKEYTIKTGDTLWRLAVNNNTSVDSLALKNKIIDPNLIYTGGLLQLPDNTSITTPVRSITASVNKKSIAAKTQNDYQQNKTVTASKSAVNVDSNYFSYTVAGGDSLWSIAQSPAAKKLGVTVDDLLNYNHGKSLINIGQVFKIKISDLHNKTDQNLDTFSKTAVSPNGTSADQKAVSNKSNSVSSAYDQRSEQKQTGSLRSSAPTSQTNSRPVFNNADSNDNKKSITASSAQSIVPKSQAAFAAPAASSSLSSQNPQSQAAALAISKPKIPSSASSASLAPAASGSIPSSASVSADFNVQALISLALKLSQQGIPYVYGGSDLSGFDCSGFVAYVFKNAVGINLPHNTVYQESMVSKHSVVDARPGDILFWGDPGTSYHDAVYIGNNQYVAAPVPGKNVEVETISPYFQPSFAGTVIH